MSQLRIRKVAVLGAGVMGAQIAAHLVNADVDTVLFDLPAKDGPPNGVVDKAIANLGKLSPARGPAPLSRRGSRPPRNGSGPGRPSRNGPSPTRRPGA